MREKNVAISFPFSVLQKIFGFLFAKIYTSPLHLSAPNEVEFFVPKSAKKLNDGYRRYFTYSIPIVHFFLSVHFVVLFDGKEKNNIHIHSSVTTRNKKNESAIEREKSKPPLTWV